LRQKRKKEKFRRKKEYVGWGVFYPNTGKKRTAEESSGLLAQNEDSGIGISSEKSQIP